MHRNLVNESTSMVKTQKTFIRAQDAWRQSPDLWVVGWGPLSANSESQQHRDLTSLTTTKMNCQQPTHSRNELTLAMGLLKRPFSAPFVCEFNRTISVKVSSR